MSPLFILGLIVIGIIAYKQGLLNLFIGGGGGGGTTPPPPSGGGGPLPPGTPFHFSSAGDFRDNTETASNLAASSPEVVVLLGDYSYSGGAPEWWSNNMTAINGMNVIGAYGNHDDDTFKDLWSLNNGSWEFIHKVSNVAFVAFDTESNDPNSIDPLLAQAQADPEVAHIIPFAHKTVWLPTEKPLTEDADRGYHDVFAKYDKIRMVLGGHNHFYARINPISGTGFPYVTVGNGGANPHDDSEEPAGSCHYHLTNGCLHCDANDQSITCTMVSNEGTTHDSFTLSPGSPPTDGCQADGSGGSGGDSEADNDATNVALAQVRRVLMAARYGEA